MFQFEAPLTFSDAHAHFYTLPKMASKRACDHDAEADSSSGATSAKKEIGKMYCHFKSSWKSQDFSISLRDGAVKFISGDVLSGVEGEDTTKCKVCGVTFSVRHGGTKDVVKFSSQNHLQAMSSTCSSHINWIWTK